MVVVPVMLSRILDALDGMERKPNLSSLRIVFVSGSQLGAELATRALKALGPVIYNLYGSTEIAFATIARPKDLSINPATVGPVVKGVKVKILDDNGNELPQGEVGRIFVGNFFPFEGYTGGGGKQIIDGLMSSGDVGYFDEHGLLYVSGRDDEMIVSGGENVFPAEVEDLISGHPEVVEATALGVEDKEWGQRLRAFVVKADGASVGEDDIKTYVKEHLARYKVPREVVFLDELPRNPTGKILKRELREIEVGGDANSQRSARSYEWRVVISRDPKQPCMQISVNHRNGAASKLHPGSREVENRSPERNFDGGHVSVERALRGVYRRAGNRQAHQHQDEQEPARALPRRPCALGLPHLVGPDERADPAEEQDHRDRRGDDDRLPCGEGVDRECEHRPPRPPRPRRWRPRGMCQAGRSAFQRRGSWLSGSPRRHRRNFHGPLMYQDRQPGQFLHAMIAAASGADPRILFCGPGRVQLGAYGLPGTTPL